MKKIFGAAILALVVLAAGCSVESPIYGPNEVVISDDGNIVITSEKSVVMTMDAPQDVQANTLATGPNGGNIWQISQNLLRYYRMGGTVYVSGQLIVEAGVNNLSYHKTVGMRYTENAWNNWQDSDGSWSQHYNWNNTDRFTIYSHSSVQPGTLIEYALYYYVDGQEYWDNNGGANFTARF